MWESGRIMYDNMDGADDDGDDDDDDDHGDDYYSFYC